jgi:hypothetical protein
LWEVFGEEQASTRVGVAAQCLAAHYTTVPLQIISTIT